MHAAVDDGDWVDVARETIQARIATYPPGSVSYPSFHLEKECDRTRTTQTQISNGVKADVAA